MIFINVLKSVLWDPAYTPQRVFLDCFIRFGLSCLIRRAHYSQLNLPPVWDVSPYCRVGTCNFSCIVFTMHSVGRVKRRCHGAQSSTSIDRDFNCPIRVYLHIFSLIIMSIRVLLLGGGGREHALAWKLSQSPLLDHLYVCPGNAGTSKEPKTTNVTDISPEDFPKLVQFALNHDVRTSSHLKCLVNWTYQ